MTATLRLADERDLPDYGGGWQPLSEPGSFAAEIDGTPVDFGADVNASGERSFELVLEDGEAWVRLTPAEARRLAAELTRFADG